MSLNQELLEYFMESQVKLAKKSPGTLENLRRDLQKFVDFVAEAQIDSSLIKEFIEIIEKQYKESSFLCKLSSLRQFIAWLNLKDNPFWDHQVNIKAEYDFFYNSDEIFASFNDWKNLSEEELFERKYDYLLIYFLYEFYLSIDELIALNIDDYNRASGQLRARDANIDAGETVILLIKDYLKNIRPGLSQNQSMAMEDPLFINARGDRISNVEVRKRVAKYGLRPLYIKKSRVVHLLDEGADFNVIEEAFAIKLSKLYKPFVKEPEYRLLKSYKDYHPRAHMQAPEPEPIRHHEESKTTW